MSFYRKRIVKNPRKVYRCNVCFGEITGEHAYESGYGEDFWTARSHIKCLEAVEACCAACPERWGFCDEDPAECLRESPDCPVPIYYKNHTQEPK